MRVPPVVDMKDPSAPTAIVKVREDDFFAGGPAHVYTYLLLLLASHKLIA